MTTPSRVSSQPRTKPFLKNGGAERVSMIMGLSLSGPDFRIPSRDDTALPGITTRPHQPARPDRETMPDLACRTHASLDQLRSPHGACGCVHATRRDLLLEGLPAGARSGRRAPRLELVRRQP